MKWVIYQVDTDGNEWVWDDTKKTKESAEYQAHLLNFAEPDDSGYKYIVRKEYI